MEPDTEARPLATLPAPLQPLEGGTFVGLATVDDRHVAVVRLPHVPEPGQLTLGRARNWARSVGGELPTRAIAALVRFVAPQLATALRYWTSDPSSRSGYGWTCGRGDQFAGHDFTAWEMPANADAPAYAVRLIPVIGAGETDELPARVAALEARLAVGLGERIAALEALTRKAV